MFTMRKPHLTCSFSRVVGMTLCSLVFTATISINAGCAESSDDSAATTSSAEPEQGQSVEEDSQADASIEEPVPKHLTKLKVNESSDPFVLAKANKEIVIARDMIMQLGGFTPEIVAALAELHRLYPNHLPSTELYGRSLEKTQRWEELVALMLEQSEETRTVDESIKLVTVLINLNRDKEALDVITPFVKKYPDNLELAKLATAANFNAQRFEQTTKLLDDYWDQFVTDRWYEILYLRGVLYLQSGEETKGIKLLLDMVKLVPEHSLAHEELGKKFMQLGEQERGQQHLDRAETLRASFSHPERVELRIAIIGHAAAKAAREQKYDESLKYIDNILPFAMGKPLAGLYFLRAQVLKAQGKDEQAKQSSDQAKRIMEKLDAAQAVSPEN